jgi:hypothetical protein
MVSWHSLVKADCTLNAWGRLSLLPHREAGSPHGWTRSPRAEFFIAMYSQARFSPDSAGGKQIQPTIRTSHRSCEHRLLAFRPARDASGDIHVNLGSGIPCRDDDVEEHSLKLTRLSVANRRTPKNRRATSCATTVVDALAWGNTMLQRLLIKGVQQI